MIQHHLYPRIVHAKRYMDTNFGIPIELAGIAEEACISQYHFHRLFKKVYGYTPHKYLTDKRIAKAKELLSGHDNTLVEICALVGFESLGSFCTLFKRQTGYTPMAYRNLEFQKQAIQKATPEKVVPHCFAFMFGAVS